MYVEMFITPDDNFDSTIFKSDIEINYPKSVK